MIGWSQSDTANTGTQSSASALSLKRSFRPSPGFSRPSMGDEVAERAPSRARQPGFRVRANTVTVCPGLAVAATLACVYGAAGLPESSVRDTRPSMAALWQQPTDLTTRDLFAGE